MIIVEKPPNIIPTLSCPVTRVRVMYRLNKVLRVASYDMVTNSLIGESTHNIDSNNKEFLVTWATPNSKSIILSVLEVLDGNTVIERWAQPFIYVPNSEILNLPQPSSVAYISKLGIVKVIRSSQFAFLDPLLVTVIRRSGYLCIYDGGNKVVEATGTSALFTLSFLVRYQVAEAFSNYVDDDSVASIIYKEPTLAPYVGALSYVKQLSDNLRFTNVGTTVEEYEETGDFIVRCRFYVDLMSSFDWHRILSIISSIAGVICGALLILSSAGVAVPMGVALISGLLSVMSGTAAFIYNTSVIESPSRIVEDAEKLSVQAVGEIDSYHSKVNNYIDYLVGVGRITSSEGSTLKSYINSIVDIGKSSIKELNEMVKKAYDDGYKKGLEDSKYWVIGAGIGGLVSGLVLDRVIKK